MCVCVCVWIPWEADVSEIAIRSKKSILHLDENRQTQKTSGDHEFNE